MSNKNLKVNIIDLFNRFKIFSYSTFQRYFKTKGQTNYCKKEFVLYLNDLYHLEYKSRKKIINLFSNDELINISKLISLIELEQYKFNIIKLIIKKIDEMNSLLFPIFIYESSKFLVNEFDNFVIYNILKNIKLNKQRIEINVINKFNSSNLKKDNERILLITEFNESLKIKEAIKINSNITLKELKEPRWVKNEKINKVIDYIDYNFNLLTISFKDNKPFQIKYNGNVICNSLKLSLFKKVLK